MVIWGFTIVMFSAVLAGTAERVRVGGRGGGGGGGERGGGGGEGGRRGRGKGEEEERGEHNIMLVCMQYCSK